jgi:hypothetical protein
VGLGREIRQIGGLGLVAAVALLAGCGDERTFTASEFVEHINEQGVSLRLGRQLETTGGAEQLHAITLPPLPGEPEPEHGHEGEEAQEHGHEGAGASGSLYVYADTGGASDQLEACRASAGLICFRAANVVVVLDEESGELAAQRLGVAIKGLE